MKRKKVIQNLGGRIGRIFHIGGTENAFYFLDQVAGRFGTDLSRVAPLDDHRQGEVILKLFSKFNSAGNSSLHK